MRNLRPIPVLSAALVMLLAGSADAATIDPRSTLIPTGLHDLADGPFLFAADARPSDRRIRVPARFTSAVRTDVFARLSPEGDIRGLRLVWVEGSTRRVLRNITGPVQVFEDIGAGGGARLVLAWNRIRSETAHVTLTAGAVPAPVPVPAAGGLLAATLAGLRLLARRRIRQTTGRTVSE